MLIVITCHTYYIVVIVFYDLLKMHAAFWGGVEVRVKRLPLGHLLTPILRSKVDLVFLVLLLFL